MFFPVYAVIAGDIQTVIAPLLDRFFIAVRVYLDRITCIEWHMVLCKEALEETLCSFFPCICRYKFAHRDKIVAVIDTFFVSL